MLLLECLRSVPDPRLVRQPARLPKSTPYAPQSLGALQRTRAILMADGNCFNSRLSAARAPSAECADRQ